MRRVTAWELTYGMEDSVLRGIVSVVPLPNLEYEDPQHGLFCSPGRLKTTFGSD